VLASLGLDKEKLVEQRAVEVGNIFSLGTKFSEPFDLAYTDEKGAQQLVIMGSYGIGISRLLGTVVEVLSDDRGMIWPESIAPFKVHLLALGAHESVALKAKDLYERLTATGIEVLFDDRADVSNGEKFANADLMGMPYRVVVSERSLEAGGAEMKKRTEEKGEVVSFDKVIAMLQ
jgi:prolyl-tRNA synthetase